MTFLGHTRHSNSQYIASSFIVSFCSSFSLLLLLVLFVLVACVWMCARVCVHTKSALYDAWIVWTTLVIWFSWSWSNHIRLLFQNIHSKQTKRVVVNLLFSWNFIEFFFLLDTNRQQQNRLFPSKLYCEFKFIV